MASGIFGEADLLANTPTNLYTVPAGKVVTFTASFCNRGTGTAKVTLRVPKTVGALTTYYEYQFPIEPGGGQLERTGLVAEAGRNIVVESDQALVSAIAHGFVEEEA